MIDILLMLAFVGGKIIHEKYKRHKANQDIEARCRDNLENGYPKYGLATFMLKPYRTNEGEWNGTTWGYEDDGKWYDKFEAENSAQAFKTHLAKTKFDGRRYIR